MDQEINNQTLQTWTTEQTRLKDRILQEDTEAWQINRRDLRLVGGLDLSFVKNTNIACCALVVCRLPQLDVVYEASEEVELSEPYIPGFLAFREVDPCLRLLTNLKCSRPQLYPQVVLLDGNGVLHPRGCGLASHLGVLADICTIGVAKNLYHWGDLKRDKSRNTELKNPGDVYYLEQNGSVVGMALKTTANASNPVFISVGHKISLLTAKWTVMQCVSQYRIPEPTRQADMRSRQKLRNKHVNLGSQAE